MYFMLSAYAASGYSGPRSMHSQTGYRLVASRSLTAYRGGVFDAWDLDVEQADATQRVKYGGLGLDVVGSSVYVGVFLHDADERSPLQLPDPFRITRAPSKGSAWAAGAVWLGKTAADWPDDCAQYENDPEPLFRLSISTSAFVGGVTAANLFITGAPIPRCIEVLSLLLSCCLIRSWLVSGFH